MARVPCLLVGDHPTQATGLARILGDLARRLARDYADVLDVRTCGWAPWADLPSQGVERETPEPATVGGQITPFPTWVFSATKADWGAKAVTTAYRTWWGDQDGFLLSVWDPGRCLEFARAPIPVTRWGYFAIDAANVNGTISGPAAEAVRRYDRVLAYTAFGADVLAKALSPADPVMGQVPHLPHGLDLNVFRPMQSEEEAARAARILRVPDGRVVIGCVATNQPRKDWGMVAQVIRELGARGHQVHLWAHTDRTVGEAWSLPQLFSDLGLNDRVTVTPPMDDHDLARCYAACVATIAPGRGEGFCYPAVESLACGCPCVGAHHSALAEVLPNAWTVWASYQHLVGPYALSRPILNVSAVTDVVESIVRTSHYPPGYAELRTKARNHALQYDWSNVWPQWTAWIDRGLGRG